MQKVLSTVELTWQSQQQAGVNTSCQTQVVSMLVPFRSSTQMPQFKVTMWTFLFSRNTSTTCGSFFVGKQQIEWGKIMKKIMGFIVLLLAFLGVAFYFGEKEVAQTKQKAEVPTVGVLQLMSHPALDAIYDGIKDGLKDSGYEIGKNVKIDFQNAQGDQSNLKSMSEKFVNEKAAATVGIATPAAQALANATTEIPIVLGAITDPVGAKLVANNKRPGGNITGVSDQAPLGAQLELIQQIMPKMKTLGIIYTSSDDSATTQAKMMESLAKKTGLTVKKFSVSSTNDITQVAAQMVQVVDAVFVPTDNTIASSMETLVAATNAKNIPVFPTVDTMVKQGGVATIGINQFKLGQETGKMVADILKGKSEPATTPIHFEKTGQLIINEKQAAKLGIKIPKNVLQKAQEKGQIIK